MDTMDVTVQSVLRLFEQGVSQKQICARLKLSHTKVTQILVTAGALETEESKLYAQGYTVEEIAQKLKKKPNSVKVRLPYSKGVYNAEYPTINALRIRKHRAAKKP